MAAMFMLYNAVSKDCLQSSTRGSASSSANLWRRKAGNPSHPAPAVGQRDFMALTNFCIKGSHYIFNALVLIFNCFNMYLF
jgi:hypothetical protein